MSTKDVSHMHCVDAPYTSTQCVYELHPEWKFCGSNMIEIHKKVIFHQERPHVTDPGNKAKSRWLRHVLLWRQNALILLSTSQEWPHIKVLASVHPTKRGLAPDRAAQVRIVVVLRLAICAFPH